MTTALEQLAARVAALRDGEGMRNYARAREHVLRWLDHGAGLSDYWREELEGAEYLLDAGPLVVERLRHHAYHVTGLRPYEYRSGKDAGRRWMADKRDALLARGRPELFVPEADALGGFGFDIDEQLVNVDTLKFAETAIALDETGVLGELRAPGGRRLSWEIGAGWGGLARVLKTLVPDMTYAIVDLPQTMLFSATYLPTVFPDAVVRFFEPDAPDALFATWEDVDFVFVPHTALDRFAPPRLDLTLNTVSFQEMTTSQVRGYVEAAWRLGSPYLYSLNRDRSRYNDQLTGVREIMATRFDLEEVVVLPVSYTKPLPTGAGKPRKQPRPEPMWGRARRALDRGLGAARATGRPADKDDYRHVLGRRSAG